MQQQIFIPENYDQSPKINTGKKENILYVFTPRKWGTQTRRPLTYNFSADNFQEMAQRAIYEASTSYGSSRGNIDYLLASDFGKNVAIPASGNATSYNLDYLSENYTFVMVTHSTRNQMQNASFTLPGSKMTIHHGYFIDEPLNMTLNSTNPTPNLNAQLVITHRTSVTESLTYGQQGQQRHLSSTDHDVINPDIMNAFSSNDTYYMAPHILHRTVGPTTPEGNYFTTLDLDSKLDPSSMQSSIESSTMMQVPHENVKHVLSAAAQTQDTVVASSELNMTPHDDMLLNSSYQDVLAANLSEGTTHTSSIGNIDTNTVYTLQHIRNLYDPIIQPIVIPKTQYFETLDQTVTSPSTVYNSFLTTCVPVYLAKASISSLSFSYESTYGNRKIHNSEPMVPMSNDELRRKVNSALSMIETYILKVIKHQRDDFEMVGNFACGGVSHSQIHFYCDNIRENAYFEMPGIFGGINSMLVGNENIATHNGFELAQLMTSLDDSDKPMVHDTRTTHSPNMHATYDHGHDAYVQPNPPFRPYDMQSPPAPSQNYANTKAPKQNFTPSSSDDSLASSFTRKR